MFENLRKIIALPLSARYFDSTANLLDSRFNSTRANGNSLCLKSLVVRDAEPMSFEISQKDGNQLMGNRIRRTEDVKTLPSRARFD